MDARLNPYWTAGGASKGIPGGITDNPQSTTLNTGSETKQSPDPSQVDSSPAVTFESITFSDGTTVTLDPTDVVVLVGPNNAGKSLALRELEQHIGNPANTTVIKSKTLLKTGTQENLSEYLRKHAQVRTQGSNRVYSGYRFSVPEARISEFWTGNLEQLRSFFWGVIHLTIQASCSISGAEGIRTPDPLLAKQALSQLSYSPADVYLSIWAWPVRGPIPSYAFVDSARASVARA